MHPVLVIQSHSTTRERVKRISTYPIRRRRGWHSELAVSASSDPERLASELLLALRAGACRPTAPRGGCRGPTHPRLEPHVLNAEECNHGDPQHWQSGQRVP